MSGKPIDEAVDLLRAFQSQFGSCRPDDDEDDAETWDRIDRVCDSLTAAQQQGQAVAGWVNGDAFVDAMLWTDDEPPHGWTPVYTAPLPSVEVDESVIARLKEAYDFGQFSDDFNQPLARLIRKDIRSLLRTLTAAQQQGQAVACERCAGSGTVTATDTTRGPDGHDFDADCPHCDGTGDVHRPDGEWRGRCNCAQPMQQGGGEVEFKERVADMLPRGTTISDPEVVAERLMRAHAASFTAPPSAPVGVEGLIAEWKMLIAHPDTSTIMRATLENVVIRLQHTLAQQPAPSAPVGADAPESVREMLREGWSLDYSPTTGCIGFEHPKGGKQTLLCLSRGRWEQGIGELIVAALTQQPAAVDGACAAAAIRFALTDPEGMTFLRLWNEGEFDTLRREWPDAPSEVYVGADPSVAQQPAAVDAKYAELLYAVSRKHPGESRHETALRYIRQAESVDHGPAQAATQHQEPKS